MVVSQKQSSMPSFMGIAFSNLFFNRKLRGKTDDITPRIVHHAPVVQLDGGADGALALLSMFMTGAVG